MKKRFVLILLSLILGAILLTSCDGGAGTGNGTGSNDNEYIFNSDVIPTIIYAEDVPLNSFAPIYQVVKDATGQIPYYQTDDTDVEAHEIVVGNTSRPITAKALRKLRTVERDNDYSSAFLIYASGGSVAIVFDDDIDDLALNAAISYFVDTLAGSVTELKLNAGVVYSGQVDALNYFAELDAERNRIRWAQLRTELVTLTGSEEEADAFVTAVQDYYEVYDAGVASWLANLYEPFNCHCGKCKFGDDNVCYGGGFYYSNSARDNDGYFPDIESTAQAVGMLTGLGFGSLTTEILGENVTSQIIQFLRECQDKNGFFYHPQWTKEDTDSHTSRRARDTTNAASVIGSLGGKLKYNTPAGAVGESKVNLTSPITSSTVAAVSKVVLAETGYAVHLESLETYKAYLDDMLAKGTSFYAIGNNISSQITQIKKRDNDLKTSNTDNSLVKYTIEWFTKHQNPDTGTWEKTANQLAINGLLKISGVFNSAKAPLPYADKAIDSILSLMYNDEKTPPVTVFNIWQSAKNVLNNVASYGSEESGIDVNDVRIKLIKNAPDAIAATAEKLKASIRADGSFAYNYTTSSSTSQGMPVAVPNSIEGDVNATMLATTGTFGGMFATYGIQSYPSPFGLREGRIFSQTISELGPVQKISHIVEETFPIDFEDETVGEAPLSVSANLKSSGSSITVISENGGNAINVISKSGSGDYVYVPNDGVRSGKSFVFEGKFRINSQGTSNSYILQISLGTSYMFAVNTSADGTLKIYEATTTSSNTDITNDIATVNKDEWFKLRFEFYCGDESTVRIKCYVNDELKVISDNYKNKQEGMHGSPSTSSLQNTAIYIMSSVNLSMDLDDLYCYASGVTYSPATDDDKGVIYDVDNGGAITPITPPNSGNTGTENGGGSGNTGTVTPPPPAAPEIFTFDNDTVGSAPAGVTTNDMSGGASFTVVADGDGDNAFKFVSASGGGDRITFNNNGTTTGSCYIFEADIKVDSTSSNGLIYRFWLGSSYYFCIRNSAAGASLEECTTDSDETAIKNPIALLTHNEWHKVRIEYYVGDAATARIKCYVDGDLLVVSDNFYGKAAKEGDYTPTNSACTSAVIFALKSPSCTMYLDDVRCFATDDKYTPATADDTKVKYNVDAE